MERKLKMTSAQTIQHIQDSMIQLMEQMEYDKITITAISDKAGINRTTFYLFYSSKKELIYDICDTFLDEYMGTFTQSMDATSQESMDRIFRQAFLTLKKKEHVLKALWEIHFSDFDPYEIMENSVAKAIYKHVTDKGYKMSHGTPEEYFSRLYAANVMATVKWWIYHVDECDIKQIQWMIKQCENKGIFSLLEK